MPRPGNCLNYAQCLLAYRNETIVVQDADPFVCPECRQPLMDFGPPIKGKPMVVQRMILGGISLLVLSGAGAVYYQVVTYKKSQVPGQIGTSFEQAQIAAEHGEFLPSRHMIIPTPAPGPPVVRAFAQFSPGDPVDDVRAQLGLDKYEVRYRSGLDPTVMGIVYFMDEGNLHIDAKKSGDAWVLVSVPLLDPSDTSAADRVAEWDRGADKQEGPGK